MGNQVDPHRYEDIIQLPHPVSRSHPPMSRLNRAAQFAPFAALTGYNGQIQEAERITERKLELNEDTIALLDETLQQIQAHMDDHPIVEVVYFQADERKEGGKYLTKRGNVKKIDSYECQLVFLDGTRISLMNIANLTEG